MFPSHLLPLSPFCSPALLLPSMQSLPPAAALPSAAIHLLLSLATHRHVPPPTAALPSLAGPRSSTSSRPPERCHATPATFRCRSSFPLQILLPRAVWSFSPNHSPTSQAKPAPILAGFQPVAWFCAPPSIPSSEPCCRSRISPGCAMFPVVRGLVVLQDSWVGLGRRSLGRNAACAAVRRSTMAPPRGPWVQPLRGVASYLRAFLRGCGCFLCWSQRLGGSGIAGTGTPPWPSSCICGRPSPAPTGCPARGNRE
jgi:hypothetical protein